MQEVPVALIPRVAKANGINLQNATNAGKFSAYVLVLKEIEIMLRNDLVGFPDDSRSLIQSALIEIRNGCNDLLKEVIDEKIRKNIMHIKPLLRGALAQITKATYCNQQTMQDKRENLEVYDIYQDALLTCSDYIEQINTLLDGWVIVN